jgi:magnesium transporter
MYRHRTTGIIDEISPDRLPAALQDKMLNLWIDMLDPTAEESAFVFEKTFHFHPLAIEDAVKDSHVPKLDDYGSYLFLVFHTIKLGDQPMDLDTFEVDVFLGPNYLITRHDDVRATIEQCWQHDFHTNGGLARGPAFLLYQLLDKQIDGYIPIIDQFEQQLELLGDQLFRNSSSERTVQLNDILTAKSSALRLRRILIPQRELLNRLATSDYAVVPSDMRIYFRDVYDHLFRLSDLADGMRDLSGSTIETHLALANNKMNEIVKLLTMISTIFIPLSFIAGVYGMNFDFMPELHWRYGYLMVWIVFLAVGGSLLYWFRSKKWL